MPCCGSVGGCGARAVSCKTPIYFILIIIIIIIIIIIDMLFSPFEEDYLTAIVIGDDPM